MLTFIDDYLDEELLRKNKRFVKESVDKLLKDYEGFLGWVDPIKPNLKIDEVLKVTEKIKKEYDCVLVCAIGGSFLGSKAMIDAIYGELYNFKISPKIIFIGNSLSSGYVEEVFKIIKEYNTCMVVISKSGTTIETSLNFKIFKDYFLKEYGNCKDRIYVITSEHKGYLRKTTDEEGYKSFLIPEDVGGRYSVLTNAGLIPMAISGLDIKEVLRGANDLYNRIKTVKYEENPCVRYALCRYLLYRENKNIEILCCYDSKFEYFSKWYVQLFGESEGKSKNAIFPSYLTYTQDLHSMGQYIQEGPQNIFETTIDVVSYESDIDVNLISKDYTELNECSFNKLNKLVMKATNLAHEENEVKNLTVQIDRVDEYNMGQLFYFFMFSCAVSATLFGVNPFNQPGVEKYKDILEELVR